jgi:hypothetical protein
MIGVDARTYSIAYTRCYQQALHVARGDTTEAKKLAQYYMRDWYVLTDGPTDRELNEENRHVHW